MAWRASRFALRYRRLQLIYPPMWKCTQARQLQEYVESTKVDLFQKNWSRAVSDCGRAK